MMGSDGQGTATTMAGGAAHREDMIAERYRPADLER